MNQIRIVSLASIVIFLLVISCSKPYCPPPEDPNKALCYNGKKDPSEQGIDCGGSCENICKIKTIVLQPGSEGIDAYVSTLSPNTNAAVYGNNITSWTAQGTPFASMVFFAFTYEKVPSTATIKSAYLTLYADTTTDFHPTISTPKGHSQFSFSNEWLLKKVVAPWDENLVTWNNQPEVSHQSTIEFPATTSRDQSYRIDVTEFVQGEFMFNVPYGFRIEMKNKIPYNAIIFYSSDGPYPALRPKIEIEYY